MASHVFLPLAHFVNFSMIFADDVAVAGGISGNGVPTPPGTTPTTARAFADPGTGHDDDAVCDDDEDPD